MIENRRFILVRRPVGMPQASDFALDRIALPPLEQGQLRVRNRYASLDPAQRGWMDDAPSYMPPIALGHPVRATTIATVEESRIDGFEPGQWIMGLNAIEDYSIVSKRGFIQKIDPGAAPAVTNFLSLFGVVGMTAYFGLLDVCDPKPGDVLLVSGAAGAVGSLVGQIARIRQCRTIGIAGGAAKCARLTSRYGFDAAIDYRGKDRAALAAAIRAAAPEGVDVIFENIGGDVLDAGLMNLCRNARVALCGLISEYNRDVTGARNLWQLIVNRAAIRGFLVGDYAARFADAAVVMGRWAAEGRLVVDEHVENGIENAYPAFMRLFDGSNQGKMILKIG